MGEKMTYAGVGVNYDAMDPFKRMAQKAGLQTADNIRRLSNGEFKELEESRGESAYLIEAAKSYFAHVEEGLGTKNLVADAMYRLTGKSYYDQIAQDTVAMIVNDMITLGALPLSVAMHLAVGNSNWFKDMLRCNDLITGWKNACNLARCVWGGGETPTLPGVVVSDAVVLSGSAMGIIKPKKRLIRPERIKAGDAILMIESAGINANGLTLARKIAENLPMGYLTEIDGKTYGELLLEPTHIYVVLIEDCLNAGVDIHYVVNITGHGWRKLMRAPQPMTYVIEHLPEQQPLFDFIQEHGPIDDYEAYGNLNMGADFALYIPKEDVDLAIKIAEHLGFQAFEAGSIENLVKSDSEAGKEVRIVPKDIVFKGDSLGVR